METVIQPENLKKTCEMEKTEKYTIEVTSKFTDNKELKSQTIFFSNQQDDEVSIVCFIDYYRTGKVKIIEWCHQIKLESRIKKEGKTIDDLSSFRMEFGMSNLMKFLDKYLNVNSNN